MLSEDERRQIAVEASRYREPRAACLDALKIVQRHRGYVPDELLGQIGALLGMSAAELDGVATFYNQIFRRPVGKHVIRLCNGVMCWMQGAESIRAHMQVHYKLEPGGTTEDGAYTLLHAPCLGLCEQAPAALVDGEAHGDLSPGSLDAVLARKS